MNVVCIFFLSSKCYKHFQMIPHELWQKIFTFLDLKSQNNVSKVSGDFCELIVCIWRSHIARLIPQFDVISEGHNNVRLNLTMKSLLEDRKYNTLGEHKDYSFLYKLLHQYKILKQIHHLEEIGDCHENFKKVRLVLFCQYYLTLTFVAYAVPILPRLQRIQL